MITKNIDVKDTATKHKHLYLSNIATDLFNRAITHFQNATDISKSLELIELENYLKEQINFVNFHIREIEFLKTKAIISSQKSNEFLKKQTIAQAILGGIKFLEKNKNEDDTWTDFMTSMGMGKAWITNYVGFQLAESHPNNPLINHLKNRILSNSESFLSYNSDIIQDGDSTNFLVGFLSELDSLSPELTRGWYKFFDAESGGWTTYLNGRKLKELLSLEEDISIDGWLSPKVCVSAVSAYVLSKNIDSKEYRKTCQYLLNNKTESYWDSYWWTSPVYATSFSILALSKSNEFYPNCDEPARWLANIQEKDGYWQNPIGKIPSSFYTALALKALFVFDKNQFHNQIKIGLNWLLKNQTLDGSWLTNRILQIPATNIIEPKDVHIWRNSSFGVNCLSDDFNRNFTTSTVVNCLSTLKK